MDTGRATFRFRVPANVTHCSSLAPFSPQSDKHLNSGRIQVCPPTLAQISTRERTKASEKTSFDPHEPPHPPARTTTKALATVCTVLIMINAPHGATLPGQKHGVACRVRLARWFTGFRGHGAMPLLPVTEQAYCVPTALSSGRGRDIGRRDKAGDT
ncbi:predicted protein [Plenodomus lingam JN3]|uniref:Predicted protein n=1 Tax=Leptosphaeria maculans (strain JN3 / isolate v23.1.3 / race Av1-4-5-6-7-8) TaxID=985895 RepID=E5A1P8_LEPMJ|nr:predicted protein [Plenodomus lingam JN3]CBX97615.1 predicted protein [Plenodomus lingam JN3]